MIYTVTFNPSLDYIIRVNDFALAPSIRRLLKSFSLAEKESMYPSSSLTWVMKAPPWALQPDLPEKRSKLG